VAIEILDTYLTSSLASGGTITFSYPSGRTAASYSPTGAVLSVPALGSVNAAPVIAIGASSATVTYTGATIPANARASLQLTLTASGIDAEPAPTYGLTSTALPRWRKARAAVRAGTGRGRILCMGDSTTAGVGATDATGRITQAWPAYMASALAGLGIPTSTKSFMGTAVTPTASYNTYNSQAVLGAGWAADGQEKVGGPGFLNSTNANTFEFTPVGNIDSFELYALQNTGQGSISWSIDAGGGTTVSLNNTPEAMYKSATLSAGAAGAHTIKIARVSGNAYIHGIVAWDSTTPGVDIINAGRGSGTTGTLITSNRGWSPLQNVATIAPDLVLLNIGINDYTPASIVALATFSANLKTLIATYSAFADVVLIVPVPSAASRQTIDIQDQYRAEIIAVGQATGAPVIDMSARWVSYVSGNGFGYYFDTVHPSRLGYAEMGNAMAAALASV
jgi:lysophospholipase L1-like esterase